MFDFLAKLDSFPKAYDDFRVRTTSGAVVSIFSIFFMCVLLFSELRYHYKIEVVDHLYVNATKQGSLKVDFDFSFPEISCSLLSIDAVDETGKRLDDVVHEVYKHQLNPHGIKLGVPEQILALGDSLKHESDFASPSAELETPDAVKPSASNGEAPACGNCYGSQDYEGQCCNTCDSVKQAYKRKGWVFQAAGVAQCSKEAVLTTLKEQFATDGGCQLYGRLEFTQGSGKFHITPHKRLHQAGQGFMASNPQGPQNAVGLFNLMDLISFTFDQFNITHKINSLRFGDHFPGIKSPLDGMSRTVTDTHGMYQYYLKVVPTRFKPLNSNKPEISSNQYSVTEHMSHLAPGSGRGLPGLYFFYEVSPIQAVFEEKRRGGLSFLVSACAIAGGFFTVMGMVDGAVGWVIATFFFKKSLLS